MTKIYEIDGVDRQNRQNNLTVDFLASIVSLTASVRHSPRFDGKMFLCTYLDDFINVLIQSIKLMKISLIYLSV